MGHGAATAGRLSQDVAERVPFERVAEREVGIEDGVGFVPPQAASAGSEDPAIHAGRHGAALGTVAAEDGGIEAGGLGAGLDDPADGAGIDGVGADHRGGEGASGARARVGGSRDPPKDRPVGDGGGILPAAQRPDRAQGRAAIGNGDGGRFAAALALGVGQGEAQAAIAQLEVRDADGGQLCPAERAREADQQQGAVAQADAIRADGHREPGDDMQMPDRGAAEVDGLDAEAAAALGGEEGDDIGGEAGEGVGRAPVAPGADAGAIGAAGVAALARRASASAAWRDVARVPSCSGIAAAAVSNQARMRSGVSPTGTGPISRTRDWTTGAVTGAGRAGPPGGPPAGAAPVDRPSRRRWDS